MSVCYTPYSPREIIELEKKYGTDKIFNQQLIAKKPSTNTNVEYITLRMIDLESGNYTRYPKMLIDEMVMAGHFKVYEDEKAKSKPNEKKVEPMDIRAGSIPFMKMDKPQLERSEKYKSNEMLIKSLVASTEEYMLAFDIIDRAYHSFVKNVLIPNKDACEKGDIVGGKVSQFLQRKRKPNDEEKKAGTIQKIDLPNPLIRLEVNVHRTNLVNYNYTTKQTSAIFWRLGKETAQCPNPRNEPYTVKTIAKKPNGEDEVVESPLTLSNASSNLSTLSLLRAAEVTFPQISISNMGVSLKCKLNTAIFIKHKIISNIGEFSKESINKARQIAVEEDIDTSAQPEKQTPKQVVNSSKGRLPEYTENTYTSTPKRRPRRDEEDDEDGERNNGKYRDTDKKYEKNRERTKNTERGERTEPKREIPRQKYDNDGVSDNENNNSNGYNSDE